MDINQARNSSLSFYLAFQRCSEQRQLPSGEIQALLCPSIVALAFSIEVGFKTLILKSGRSPSGHDLEKLFKLLDPGDQQAIRDALSIDNLAFDNRLRSVSKAFVEWRYIYEVKAAQMDFEFLSDLAKVTQDLLGP